MHDKFIQTHLKILNNMRCMMKNLWTKKLNATLVYAYLA